MNAEIRKQTMAAKSLWCGVLATLVVLLTPPPALAQSEDDPWEGFNRAVFKFNDTADTYVVRPVAVGYDAVMPDFARVGVNNIFSNFLDVNGLLNALLQGELNGAWRNTSRVVLNTTLGFFGVFDVASDMGIERYPTDFGHTLAKWGVGRGPYVMLPLFGPNTVRSSIGFGVDAYASPMGQLFDDEPEWGLRALNIVDLRAGLLGSDELVTGDRYIFIRDAFLQRREALVNDGRAKDNFSEFEDDWESDGL
ncbi:VacJ family lipoprotein [Luminiphilus syltensis NOR5-1B]|uniref:VacJ family lipoprotein n=1 Tax=Luminiphilus syltensis NOR5-1B TaxID=565045 RepID=B8KXL8_9GAMM|nr:VacJ family lipoprotein [Luminiphilus syltensis]EED34994.1 VacJ family lipoprotein [Luminiphilus syltensis NOR5-1B]